MPVSGGQEVTDVTGGPELSQEGQLTPWAGLSMYRHPSLSAVNLFQKNRALIETTLSEGTFSIRINVNRSNLYSHRVLQWYVLVLKSN
jgi:hypothetical protein